MRKRPSSFEKWLESKFGEKSNNLIITFTMFISFILSVFLFIAIPTGVASFFSRFNISSIGLNLIEAVIKICILLGYMLGISKLDDMYRLFQYHGAEHKTIFCYEAGDH